MLLVLLAEVLYRVQEQRAGQLQEREPEGQIVSKQIMVEYRGLVVSFFLDTTRPEPQPRRAHNLRRSNAPRNPLSSRIASLLLVSFHDEIASSVSATRVAFTSSIYLQAGFNVHIKAGLGDVIRPHNQPSLFLVAEEV